MSLNELAREVHSDIKAKGFWTENPNIPEKLMLVVTEVSEAANALRKKKRTKYRVEQDKLDKTIFEYMIKDTFEDEIADTFIRLFDLAGYLNIDLDYHVNAKIWYNKGREYKHGVEEEGWNTIGSTHDTAI